MAQMGMPQKMNSIKRTTMISGPKIMPSTRRQLSGPSFCGQD
jgi:hypothetical protein